MSKDYEAKPKPTSPYNDDLHNAYINGGGVVEQCAHGASGGHTALMKEMIAKSVNQAKRKRKTA
jgi:hypothetical protein